MKRALLFTLLSFISAVSSQAASKSFNTPKEAADALIQAASAYDVPALLEILGPDGKDLVTSKDPVLDKERAEDFSKQAQEKNSIHIHPNNPSQATLIIGKKDWPLPIP